MGIPLPTGMAKMPRLDVGTPAPARACRAAGATGHKLQLNDADLREWLGLRVTTPARTWCDLAAVLELEDLVAAA